MPPIRPSTPLIRAAGIAVLLAGMGHAAVARPAEVVGRHHPHRHHRAPVESTAPIEPAPPGGYDNPRVNNGSFSQFAPDDPERPYGANSTVTAPPGTAAAEEQENNRRYFCNFSPEHC